MTDRYLYDYKLTIGLPLNIKDQLNSNGGFSKTVDSSVYSPASEKEGQGNAFLITGLQVTFSISKDDSADANNSSIDIYNLSDNTVNYLTANANNRIVVKLEAGYKSTNMKQLFIGTVDQIKDVFEGDTRKTSLELSDGTAFTREAHSSVSFPKGTPTNTVVKTLVKDLGLPKGNIVSFSEIDKVLTSRAMSGNTHQLLKTIAEMKDSDYHIQDGKVNIIPKAKRVKVESAYISPDTGLIGSPQPIAKPKAKSQHKIGTSETPRKHKTKKIEHTGGISFSCQLDGSLTVGSTIWLKSKNYDCALKLYKVQHSGSYEGGDWKSECEGTPISATID